MSTKTVLIVCMGNIHRSVIAELCIQKELAAKGRRDIRVISRGIQGTGDNPPPKALNLRDYPAEYNSSKPYLDQIGIEIPHDKRSAPVDIQAVQEADKILASDRGILDKLIERFPKHADKMKLLSEISRASQDVNDPAGKPQEVGQVVLLIHHTVKQGIDTLIDWLDNSKH